MIELDEAQADAEDENILFEVERLKVVLEGALCGEVKGLGSEHRTRYVVALNGVSDFLQKVGATKEVVADFRNLVEGLAELDEGVVRPFLKHAERKRITRDADDLARAKARIAFAFYLYLQSGFTRSKAKALVMRARLPGEVIARLKEGRSRGLQSVTSWYDQLEEETFGNQAALLQYKMLKRDLLQATAGVTLPSEALRRLAKDWLHNWMEQRTPGTLEEDGEAF